jgi:hypothetical protein
MKAWVSPLARGRFSSIATRPSWVLRSCSFAKGGRVRYRASRSIRSVRRRGSSQAKIAERYGVATTSLSGRFQEIQLTLGLVPGDPRYTAG